MDDSPDSPRSIEISALPQLLAGMRAAGPQGWGTLDCQFEGEGPAWHDRRATARLAVLLALQYDRRGADRSLVLHILTQEIRAARTSPFQGIGTNLQVAARLASGLRDPTLAFMLLAAKEANFDTACGLDSELLWCSDIAATLAWVRASEHPDRDRFLEHLGDDGEPEITQVELDAWWDWQHRQYPSRWEDQTRLSQVSLCSELGDHQHATALLERWLAAPDEGLEESQVLSTALSWWETLGFPDRAAAIQRRLDQWQPESAWDRACQLHKSAAVHARAGDLDRACARLDELAAALADEPGWQRYGLGLQAVETGADVALAAAHTPAAMRRAFAWTEALMAQRPRTSLVVLEKLRDVAGLLGEAKRAAHYESLASAERERIARL